MAGEGVAKVSASAVFKAARFNDLFPYGIIDKLDKNGHPAGERYTEEADLDEDGRILLVEAKYYLRYILQSEKAKQFPMTKSDWTALLDLIFGATKLNSWQRSYKGYNVIANMVKAGVFKEALPYARRINDSGFKIKAFRDISLKMAEVGLCDDARAVAREVDDAGRKWTLFHDLAIKMADGRLFEEALKTAAEIENSLEKSTALDYIKSKMAEAGMRKKEIMDMIDRCFTKKTNNWKP